MAARDEDDDDEGPYKFRRDDDDPLEDQSVAEDASSVDLVRCRRCRKYCYEEAVRCPHCGEYMVRGNDGKPQWYVTTVIVCLLAIVVVWIGGRMAGWF